MENNNLPGIISKKKMLEIYILIQTKHYCSWICSYHVKVVITNNLLNNKKTTLFYDMLSRQNNIMKKSSLSA